MKALKSILTVAAIMVAALSASAQRNKTIKEIADMKGVESTYITNEYRYSADMLEKYNDNLSIIATNSKGTYIIDVDDTSLISSIYKKLDAMVNNGKYRLLMRTKSDEDLTCVYALPDDNKGYKEKVMITKSNDELSVIYNEW